MGARLAALEVLFEAESWADVVRESQEIVELTLKALLRTIAIDPPRIHDVSGVLLAERARIPLALEPEIEALAEASRTSGAIGSSPSTARRISRRPTSIRARMLSERARARGGP